MLVRRSVLQPYPASISTTPRGSPALQAASICSSAICRPFLRQIETIHCRQTGVVIGKRQGYRDLAVILLAELPAILTRHTDRVRSLLGKTGVIDDPRFDRSMALYRRQYHLTHFGQNTLVRPRRLAD